MGESRSFQITGWPAMLLALLLLGFSGIRFFSARSALDATGINVLKQQVSAEYLRYQLARTDVSEEERKDLLVAASTVSVISYSARGPLDNTVVKVVIAPNRAQPPGQSNTQYYRLEHSSLSGWRYLGDASIIAYYFKAFSF